MKDYYVTTTIPYVNARPHIGFALELVQADALARYLRLCGQETRLQTGADENSLKNVLAARELGISPQALVDKNTAEFRRLSAALDTSFDDFVRTTEARHRLAVEAFWRRLNPEDIYKRSYVGAYCVGCEDFLNERDLVEGCCVDHGTAPTRVEEENYFFRLSGYQRQVEEALVTDKVKIIPEGRKNEILAFVRNGLEDISISRSVARAGGWGIPVPGDSSQVVYVWFDALVNYLSGPGFGIDIDWQEYWGANTRKIHVIGKNVWKFHAVYWPAFLLSAGLSLPDEIFIHGFLTEEGRKISKSLGNAIDPFACIEQASADGLRYYLLRAISPFWDGDFSIDRLIETYNTDLANNLGNLVSRLATICEKADHGGPHASCIPDAPEGFHDALADYRFDNALKILWSVIDDLNREIDRVEPWRLLKNGQADRVGEHLDKWLAELHRAAYWLSPFLPEAAAKIKQTLAQEKIRATAPLFPRISQDKYDI